MQRVMMISNEASIKELNTLLAEEEFVITKVSGCGGNQWLVVLDDEPYEDLEELLEYEEDEHS